MDKKKIGPHIIDAGQTCHRSGRPPIVSCLSYFRLGTSPHIRNRHWNRDWKITEYFQVRCIFLKLSEPKNTHITPYLDDDPFVILPAKLKNYEKLGADLFFNLLVKIALYSLVVSIVSNGRNVTNNSI